MRRMLLFCCLSFILSTSNGQKAESLLFRAYKKKSLALLENFFEYWHSEIPSISNEDLHTQNDTIKNIYSLFQAFYNPLDIDRNGGSEWGNLIYQNVKYLITQDKILFGFADTLEKDLIIQKEVYRYAKGSKSKIDTLMKDYKSDPKRFERMFLDWPILKMYDTLKDFRPQLNFTPIKTVILTKYYDSLLNIFLGNAYHKFAEENIMSPARSKGESKKRQNFLSNYIKIWYGHWGGYWQLHSYPYASTIIFDREFKNAVVNYRMIYEGGYAYFKKIDSNWTLIEAKLTWIE